MSEKNDWRERKTKANRVDQKTNDEKQPKLSKNKKFEMKLKIVAIGRRRIDCWWTGALDALGALGACGKCLFSFVCLAEANLVDWNRNEFIVFFFFSNLFFSIFLSRDLLGVCRCMWMQTCKMHLNVPSIEMENAMIRTIPETDI